VAVAVKQNVIWTANPGPQTDLIRCPVFEVFYGGARGGGKTEGSIGDWLEHSDTYGELAVGVFFRRTFKQLEEVIARTKQLFPKIGARYNEQRAEWTMPKGGRLKFRYIQRDSDAEEYQGHSYTRVYVEEAPNFPSPRPINLLRATLRSAAGVPCGMRLTGNPGGPGHSWVKARYIDPNPRGYQILTEEFTLFDGTVVKQERVFIPSKIKDNAPLMKNDPGYVARLRQVGSEQLVKAWLEGDWDAVEGAFFNEWDERIHVLPSGFADRIPHNALKFGAFDWGSAKPFSYGNYALSDGTWGLPRGALLKYQEWYGASAPNVGLKMDATMVARGIKEREMGQRIRYRVADPSIFVRDGGPSIAESMAIAGVSFRRADNKRIVGWEQVHIRLKGLNYGTVNWQPLLYVCENCEDTIRTLPILQHDEVHAEDIDTEGEDHAGDETRYAVMSRPRLLRDATEASGDPELGLLKPPRQPTIMELVERQRQRRLAASE